MDADQGLRRGNLIPPVLFLMGPTASGKTDLAAALSERFPVELINVDAAQVYRGMDIGTAKPTASFLSRYPHHLIDIRDPSSAYSAAEFVRDARALIEAIRQRGAIPLLVGGTMFYFRALELGLAPLPPADKHIRARLRREMADQGVRGLHTRIAEIDAIVAARIKPTDSQRVQRALEIHYATGAAPSTLLTPVSGLPGGATRLVLFSADRQELHRRIGRRFQRMLDLGLEAEVSRLFLDNPLPEDTPTLRIVGYRQVLDMLRGDIDRSQMFDSAVAATRQLAKRQLTWLRQQAGLVWIPADRDEALKTVTNYLVSHPEYREFAC